jgi:hypothetical protein
VISYNSETKGLSGRDGKQQTKGSMTTYRDKIYRQENLSLPVWFAYIVESQLHA